MAIFQVDAFSSNVFAGNPAAVCLLDAWIDDSRLQSIAAENNLSETAFLVPRENGFEIRWFTPKTDVALCGHATLASAFVQFFCQKWRADSILFHTRKSGQLIVKRYDDLIEMDFPARPSSALPLPDGLCEASGVTPTQVLRSAEDLLVVLQDENAVLAARPDFAALERLEWRAIYLIGCAHRIVRRLPDIWSQHSRRPWRGSWWR